MPGAGPPPTNIAILPLWLPFDILISRIQGSIFRFADMETRARPRVRHSIQLVYPALKRAERQNVFKGNLAAEDSKALASLLCPAQTPDHRM
jgi:hypothetical protein